MFRAILLVLCLGGAARGELLAVVEIQSTAFSQTSHEATITGNSGSLSVTGLTAANEGQFFLIDSNSSPLVADLANELTDGSTDFSFAFDDSGADLEPSDLVISGSGDGYTVTPYSSSLSNVSGFGVYVRSILDDDPFSFGSIAFYVYGHSASPSIPEPQAMVLGCFAA